MNRADLNVHIVWRSTPSISRYGCVHPTRSGNTKNNKSNPLSVADHTTPLCNRHSLPTHPFIWSSVMMRSESVLKAHTRPHSSRTFQTGFQMHCTLSKQNAKMKTALRLHILLEKMWRNQQSASRMQMPIHTHRLSQLDSSSMHGNERQVQ
jgi:hypothetical protein